MTTAQILARFPALRALVVGDVCLDRWCAYDPVLAEPSRETGLNRVAVTSTDTTAGAAGTVANNLKALGAGRVAVMGTIGDDGHGYELRRALTRVGIETGYLLDSGGPTFTYTKLLNSQSGEEDLGRLDFLPPARLTPQVERELISRFAAALPEFDVVVVSDQAETENEGTITPAFRERLTVLAAANPERVIWVDSRMRPEKFRGVIVKPNEREATEACLRAFGRKDFQALRAHIGHELLFVTHGDRGALIVRPDSETWVDGKRIENPVDICGAGDSFSAGASLALAAGATPEQAVRTGNFVASVTIMKKGTGTASPAEVLAAEQSA